MNSFCTVLVVFFASTLHSMAQNRIPYWQQRVDYTMAVEVDVKTFQYTGTQKLVYTNNSPDVLPRVYYHLYFNAFQPGSEMDIRLQHIQDPDPRMLEKGQSRIAALSESEMGYLHVESLTQDGQTVAFTEEGTILVVDLAQPIPAGGTTVLEMTFKGQVPVHIRRAGRNNTEGVALSMGQWYPKLSEYDVEGWHPNPYIGREFHGVWGNFDVKLTLDKHYTVGASGYLQNPREVGHGYETPGTKVKTRGKTLTWHFKAPNVHDFMWAADPGYLHDIVYMEDGPTLHFFYKNDPKILENWKKLQPKTVAAMQFFTKNLGKYPYEQYAVIQGGDGGMEYPMSTLITGKRTFASLVGVMVHELAHSWFQQALATNEAKYAWMDEGFTTFISTLCMNDLMELPQENPFKHSYQSYYALVNSGLEQPQTTHADRYTTNFAYGVSAYSKGAIFLSQLGYIIGQDRLMETLKRYYETFTFKHPFPNDFKRIAEKVSGMELDWYLTDWTQTTNTIDYAIQNVEAEGNSTKIVLERLGEMPMPLDIVIVNADGTRETYYIPLRMLHSTKENPYPQWPRTVLEDWPWAYPTYTFMVNRPLAEITTIILDPSLLMADVNRENNVYPSTP